MVLARIYVRPCFNRPLSPVEVAAEALPQHTLRVLWHPGRVNRGMGAAMSLALLRARHDIIGKLEHLVRCGTVIAVVLVCSFSQHCVLGGVSRAHGK